MAKGKRSNKLKDFLADAGMDAAGSTGGALLGLAVGGPGGAVLGAAGAPLLSRAFKYVGAEISNRFLSQNEKVRVGSVLWLASQSIEAKIQAGLALRDDGFFGSSEGEASSGREVLEGVLIAAQREHEERKIDYYSNLLCSIAFDSTVDRDEANFLIKIAASLTYRDLCILSLAAVKGDSGLRDCDYKGHVEFEDELIIAITQAYALYNLGLLNFGGRAALGISSVIPGKMGVHGAGARLYNLMELSKIPSVDIEGIAKILR